MTDLDDEFLPLIKEMIEEDGVQRHFVVDGSTSYNPDTRKVTHTDPVNTSWWTTPLLQYKQHLIDGDTIQRGDVKIYIAAKDLTFTPTVGMKVKPTDSVDPIYRIVEASPIHSGESVAAWRIQLRAA